MASKSYTISFLGDVMLGRLIDQLCTIHVECSSEARHVQRFRQSHPELLSYAPVTPWGNSLSLLQSSNLRLINLETAVTTHDIKWPDKIFNYRMHPANLEILKAASIDYVTLANNHTLDFSTEGLGQTVTSVGKAGLAYAGAALSVEGHGAPGKPALLDLQGHSIHVFAASDHPSDWRNVPQFNFIDYTSATKTRLKQQIEYSGPAALKVFSVHWGPNYSWHPDNQIQDLAHYLIDECGIDMIHGHSSHHIQGVEIYHGKPIIYGCGDFIDDYALTQEYRNDLSAVWQLIVEKTGVQLRPIRIEIFPSRIKNFQANLLPNDDKDHEWVQEKVRQLSETGFGTKVRKNLGEQGQIVIDIP